MCIKIALTNLGKYNEGILDFVWLSLPATPDEISAAYDQIEVSHDDIIYYSDGCGHASKNKSDSFYGAVYEEVFITDFECDFYEVGEYENIDNLNDIADAVSGLCEYEQDILKGLMRDCGMDLEEALDNIDNVLVYPDCYDMTDVAYQYIEECGILHGVPDNIANYFDYEAFGRDMSFDGSWFDIDGGKACLL